MYLFFQEEYHAADLRKELSNIKKILIDEKRRSNGDMVKVNEMQTMFATAMKAYQESVDHMKHMESSKKKNNDEAAMNDRAVRDNNRYSAPKVIAKLYQKFWLSNWYFPILTFSQINRKISNT